MSGPAGRDTIGAGRETGTRLPRAIANRILDHVREDTSREVCGLIGARDGVPVRCMPIANVAVDPSSRYRMDPAAMIQALFDIERAGETLFAIYHSHPAGPAAPSRIDIAEASWPDALYLIVSLDTRGVLEMRGFRIRDGKAAEVGLRLD